MTSQIVSSSIDENFPIAGQDNDSQGFRDNFSIIKDGLATASSEITVLQSTTAKIDETNNFNGTLIENALTNQLYGKVFAITTAGTTVIDYRSGEYHVVTVAGNHSLRFQQFAGSDPEPVYAKIRLELSPSGAGPSGWNVTFTAPAGGSVTGTVGFPTLGENPIINIGDNADLKTVVDVWTTNGKDFYVGLIGSFSQEYDLASLTDVILTSPSQGQVLVYNNTTGKWANGTPSVTIGSIESLENVGDVTYEDLAIGDTLRWNGVNWTPATIAGLNDLSDVIIDTLNTNHVLKYNGTNWINTALLLGELGNVTTVSPVEGDIIRYDADDSTWKNEKDPNLFVYTTGITDFSSPSDRFIIDGANISSGMLTFHLGNIYRFNLSGSSNKEGGGAPRAPLRFATSVNLNAGTVVPYETNVRIVGTPGLPGSYVEIQITKDTPDVLYIYGDNSGTMSPTGQPKVVLGGGFPIPVIKTAFYTGSENLISSAASTVLSTSYFSTNKVIDVSVGGINNNYLVIPTISFTAPSSGVTATGTVRAGVVSVSVANAGTDYTVGNVLTIVGGTGTAATVTVATITGGGATGPIGTVTLTTAGNYSVLADLTDLTVTGGSGNSALITITALKINSVVITESGSGYTSAPTITIDPPSGNATLTALTNLGIATLAEGVEGQVKTFAMYADSGDMVITVSNAGWNTSGSGTVTFDTIGQACTLQYINGKWFCVGNNGAVFA
jgi:hypothetical protein